jgi:DNA-binding transcriptional regulator YhcF (GntR family)
MRVSDPSGPQILITAGPGSPPYEQVRQQIADLIESGALPAGSRLRPVRQLAGDLRLAPGTVARAYSALESAGLVQTRRGGGTIVAHRLDPTPGQRRAQLAQHARDYAAASRRLGFDADEALDAVRRALD